MAPAVGSTEMRYCGISLLSRLASATPALWPAVPTGGVPQRISCCDQAAEAEVAIRAATATDCSIRWSMAFPFRYSLVQAVALPPRPREVGAQSVNRRVVARTKKATTHHAGRPARRH